MHNRWDGRRLRFGPDRQCVDVGLHKSAQGRVNGPMALEHRHSLEGRTDHPYPEVSAAVASPFMPCMQMALVHDLKFDRFECSGQCSTDRFHPLFPRQAHGSTRLNGRTSTRA